MRINRNIVSLSAVAVVAFVAGRAGLFAGGSVASADPQDQPPEMPEMTEEMEAMIKAGMPGGHHAHLNDLVGEWEGTFKVTMQPDAPPMEMEGRVKRDWVLDGRYIQEEVVCETPFGVFRGIGFVGYNNIDGEYQIIWMDNQSTAIYMETGTLDPKTMQMRTRGSQRNPATGQVMWTHGTLDLSSPDHHSFIGYQTLPNGTDSKMMEGSLYRK
jgi:hypothetical protein